jgi:hypothetical protein
LAEQGGRSEKVGPLGESALKKANSGMGGIGGRERGFWVGGARDKGWVEGVREVDVEDMLCIFSVRHTEGHGSSGVMGDTEGSSRRPDGAEPVIVIETGVSGEGDGDSNVLRGGGRGGHDEGASSG